MICDSIFVKVIFLFPWKSGSLKEKKHLKVGLENLSLACTGKTAKLHDWLIKWFLFFPQWGWTLDWCWKQVWKWEEQWNCSLSWAYGFQGEYEYWLTNLWWISKLVIFRDQWWELCQNCLNTVYKSRREGKPTQTWFQLENEAKFLVMCSWHTITLVTHLYF